MKSIQLKLSSCQKLSNSPLMSPIQACKFSTHFTNSGTQETNPMQCLSASGSANGTSRYASTCRIHPACTGPPSHLHCTGTTLAPVRTGHLPRGMQSNSVILPLAGTGRIQSFFHWQKPLLATHDCVVAWNGTQSSQMLQNIVI